MCFWAWLGLAVCLCLAPGLVLGWLWVCSGLVWGFVETPLRRSRTYNTMTMTSIPRRSPRGPPPYWLKNFKSQRVNLETPWVSTGIWWVSASCVCYALGSPRVSSRPPWVSTGIRAFGLTFLWFALGFHRYVFIVCVISFTLVFL